MEVCCYDLESALNAQEAGANIEHVFQGDVVTTHLHIVEWTDVNRVAVADRAGHFRPGRGE